LSEESADRLNRNATAIEAEESGNTTELAQETRKLVTTPLGKITFKNKKGSSINDITHNLFPAKQTNYLAIVLHILYLSLL